MAAQATVIYPPGNAFTIPVNIEDSIEVTYTSDWAAVNLTVLCLGSATADDSIYLYHNVDDNPILANGSYTTPSIESMEFEIRQYPTECKFRLTEFGDNANNVDGGQFMLTTTNGSPTTFGISATILPTSSSIRTSSTVSTDTGTSNISTSVSSATIQANSTVSPEQTETSSSSAQTSLASESMSSPVSNKPVTAAVAIGIALGAISLAIIIVWTLATIRRKKQRRIPKDRAGSGYEKAELAGDALHSSQVAHARSTISKRNAGLEPTGSNNAMDLTMRTSTKRELTIANVDQIHPALRSPLGDTLGIYARPQSSGTTHELGSVRPDGEIVRHELE